MQASRRLVGIAAAVIVGLALPPVAAGREPQLKRYPYLTDVSARGATVSWATDRSQPTARVRYGRVGSESCTANSSTATRSSITVNGTSEYSWRATLAGLAPGAAYCYRVELGTSAPVVDLLGTDPSPRFQAQLPAGSTEPFSFAVLGDWGAVGDTEAGPGNRQADVMAQIAASGARFAVGTGDTAYPGGSQTNYGDLVATGANVSAVFAPGFWGRVGATTPLFNVVGNHGFNNTFLSIWPQGATAAGSAGRYAMDTYCCLNGTSSASYPSAWYAFDAGSARFYMLEAAWGSSNNGSADAYKNDYDNHWSPASPEYQWLENDLRSHPSQVKFAVFHFPLYSSNSDEASDTYLQGPNSLEGLLARNGVDIGFSGHAHNYTRNVKPNANGLVTYVTGGGGARVRPANRCGAPVAYAIGWSYSRGGSACGAAPRPTSTDQVFHFLKVSVDGRRVTVAPTDSQGRTFDVQTYDFPAESGPPPPDQTPPTVPALSAAAPSSRSVELSWSASSDASGVAGYEIYRDGAPLTTTSGAGTTHVDTAVAPNTTYAYKVRAVDAAGNLSDFSNTTSVTTPAGPAAIRLVKQATAATATATTGFTIPIASSGGDALVASIAVQAGSTTSVASVVDSAGNAWTRGPIGFLAGSNTRVELWYSAAAAPVASATVNLSAPDLASANVSEWSGVASLSPVDASAGRGNMSATTVSTPPIATANANDVIIGAINFPQSVTSTLSTGSFSSLDDFTASTVKGRAAYQVVAATGSYSAAWALSGAATSGAAIIALKGAP